MTSSIKKILIFVFTITYFIVNGQQETLHFKIGFSQCTSNDTWRQLMQREMQYGLALYPGIELIIEDAKNDSWKQIKDIENLIEQDIDLLIVSPNESKPLTPILENLYKDGFPVIIIDRKIDTDNYSAFIGADNYQIGEEAGKYAAKLLNGKGKIAEIWGLKGSSPAIERHNGFINIISKYPQIEIMESSSGEWEKTGGIKVMENLIKSDKEFDLVFAHNDYMALGAYEVFSLHKKGINKYFIGIDGLPGESGGVQAVIDNKLVATFLYPTGGDLAIDIAWNILNELPYKKDNILNTVVIDSTNAQVIQIQTEQILSLQNKIDASKNILVKQVKRFNSQQFWLIVALISLSLILILTILMVKAYRKKNAANKRIENQRKIVENQNEELKKVTKQLEIATQEKLSFFTNISHEFRTPLTLILGPLENMISQGHFDENTLKQLKVMQRNASRLLRLINQLMDLRKIENAKMKLNTGYYDIVSFVKEIKETFSELAYEKNIEYSFVPRLNNISIYFDKDKIDKVLFNLLSNAFKFTNAGGKITIKLNQVERKFNNIEKKAVLIEVSDNGRGISESHLARIFERFYQVEQQIKTNVEGTGLGLTLTKNLVQLHKGDIDVESKKGEGTTFKVYLQTGREHLNDDDITNGDTDYYKSKREIQTLPDEIDFTPQLTDIDSSIPVLENSGKEIGILVVEDEKDIREYIKNSLSDSIKIYEAGNGKEALKIIEEDEPELIITDVMMPEMDGLELTRILKGDIKTCHIPIIMLTARATQEHKIEGLEEGADSYIPKPFNPKHLQVRVKKLIESRVKIRKHYRENTIIDESLENGLNRLDKNFLKKAINVIENNLLNSNFGVEELSGNIGLSRVHLYRKIKHITGATPSEFITNIRLQKAQKLLLESGKTIAEIAYEIGFSSPSYFSKCFKERYKISPTDYINKNKD